MEKFYSLKTLLKLAGGRNASPTSLPPGSATVIWVYLFVSFTLVKIVFNSNLFAVIGLLSSLEKNLCENLKWVEVNV